MTEPKTDSKPSGLGTLAVRAGLTRTSQQEHTPPLYMSTSYMFSSAEEAEQAFASGEGYNIYSRFTNPTVTAFEQRLAALEGVGVEGAEQIEGVAFSSGMAAILAIAMGDLKPGDRLVASAHLFGTTYGLFNNYLSKFGIEVSWVYGLGADEWQEELAANKPPAMVFVEIPTNPFGHIIDIGRLAKQCHQLGAKLVVDSTLATPVLVRPLSLGADLVVHSCSKYVDGHGRVIGGCVLGKPADLAQIKAFRRTAGPTMGGSDAWQLMRGLETLPLRIARVSSSAMQLSLWLQDLPQVVEIFYPGLPHHPSHQLATQLLDGGYGGVIAFTLDGANGNGSGGKDAGADGRQQAFNFLNATQLLSLTANIGDSRSTVVHPATTTHGKLPPQDQARIGIKPSTVRICLGLEDVEDLKEDIANALAIAYS